MDEPSNRLLVPRLSRKIMQKIAEIVHFLSVVRFVEFSFNSLLWRFHSKFLKADKYA
jgi:hypothetical protein